MYKKLHILQLCCRILGCNIVTASSSSCSLHLLQFSTISTVCRLLSAICRLTSTAYPPLSIVHRLPSTVFRLLSTNRNRKLSICKLWLQHFHKNLFNNFNEDKPMASPGHKKGRTDRKLNFINVTRYRFPKKWMIWRHIIPITHQLMIFRFEVNPESMKTIISDYFLGCQGHKQTKHATLIYDHMKRLNFYSCYR